MTKRIRFSGEEYRLRMQKTLDAMSRAGIETLIVYDPSNMAWLTGYDGWSFYVHQCVVLNENGSIFWFGRGIDGAGARLTTYLSPEHILTYPDHYVQSSDCHPMDYLAAILADLGWGKGTIGVEKDNYYFSAKAMESLLTYLPDATFLDANSLVNWQRAVKSETEIDYMRRAARVIEKTYERILDVAEPGMRKNDLVAEIYHATIKGSDEFYGDYPAIVPLIGSGIEAAACHMTWDDGILEKDTGMFMELAGAYHRYHCPVSRTLYLGTPPDSYRRVEAAINECIEKTLVMFRPGNTCGEVASTFFEALRKCGYDKDNRCGYPIGLSYPPDWGERTMSLRAEDKTVLEAGMTFHFMPGLWFEDWGFEMTESVLVTEEGGECLAAVPRELFVK
ncbi:M24 family metallopeptidase [Sneathiella chinensis]|uniref:Ectoine hydrolase DoeA n=1 Tax=Sneathiella chinensis TaxID=349750 RepID=A0ABQ5TZB2_9PROT|nr:M24 family metallopeptidase [Sneathiella chinensis]GLQ04828.1 ectoine hydrolase DoeA [Sneathiella chinensis]